MSKPNSAQSTLLKICKLQGRSLSNVVASGSHSAVSNTFSLTDHRTGQRYLIDTGADVSVFPAALHDKSSITATSSLCAANGTSIRTWGKCRTSLEISPNKPASHEFVLADVTRLYLVQIYLLLILWLSTSRGDVFCPLTTIL